MLILCNAQRLGRPIVDGPARRPNHPAMPPREPAPFWEMMDAAERSPLTSAWDRRFLAGIRALIDERDDPWLTEDQSRVLAVIALKAGVVLPEGVRDLVDGRPGQLMAFALGALGDPRLTAWEGDFL
jgi:hypothetical protein